MDKKSIGKLVSNDGIIINDLYEGDRIIRKETVDYLSETDVWNLEHFYKANSAELILVLQELNVYEKAFLLSMANYIGYDDCCLKYSNGNIIDFDDIVQLTGMSRGKASQVINCLRKQDIIYKGFNSKGIQYFINPWLFCRGNRIQATLKTMFQNYKIRTMGGTRWKDLK